MAIRVLRAQRALLAEQKDAYLRATEAARSLNEENVSLRGTVAEWITQNGPGGWIDNLRLVNRGLELDNARLVARWLAVKELVGRPSHLPEWVNPLADQVQAIEEI
jgi:hypothetical protein